MENKQSQYLFLQPAVSETDSLLMTIFAAAVIHVILILSIGFVMPKPQKITKQIEVTLASLPSKTAPKKAEFLAQENQLGAGDNLSKPTPPKQQIASLGDSEKKPPKLKRQPQKLNQKVVQAKVITQKKAEQKIVSKKTPVVPTQLEHSKLSVEALKEQIAQLGAQIRYSKQSSEKTKIKFVKSVSTHKYVAAQYMKDWEQKVERTGNLNYPEVARKKGFSGSLMMDVGINADGTIYSMRITRSSGNKALDDAAKRIVRLSAPFAELPKELLNELDVLVIPRVWSFSDETGVLTR